VTAIADPIAAVVAMLKADAGVIAAASTRVYGGELPRAQSDDQPRKALVVKAVGGGSLDPGYQRWGDHRLDVIAYGETPHEAYELWRTAHAPLKDLARSKHAGTVLFWARPAGGPVAMRDADTDWPIVVSSWQVLASEVPV
jgi:hypothetical protein